MKTNNTFLRKNDTLPPISQNEVEVECNKILSNLTAYVNSFLTMYEEGNVSSISTDEARIFTPFLSSVVEEDLSPLMLLCNKIPREISRKALTKILEDLPEKPIVCIYGVSGAGKTSMTIKKENYIRFEGGAYPKEDELLEIINYSNNREIKIISITAEPKICGKRVAMRALYSEKIIDKRYFPQYMLCGYKKSIDEFINLKSKYKGKCEFEFYINNEILSIANPNNIIIDKDANVTAQEESINTLKIHGNNTLAQKYLELHK